jgi:hypothetical protein
MKIVMSEAFTINVLWVWEHNWQLINNFRSIIDDSSVMVQLVASFTIVIYDCHIFIVQATYSERL